MDLEKRKIVVFTPSRRVGGKRVVCYDDRFIVKVAHESDGVIVSNDTYRDLQGERPEWKKCIEERLLMYSFVNDKFMPPDDPLGRHGPSLDNLLRRKPLPIETKKLLCPYDKKCTYGIKCKFYHPERVNQSYLSLADELREKAQISTAKDEKNARQSPRQHQAETAHTHNSGSPHRDSTPEHIREGQGSSQPGHVSENKVLYWENPRISSVHVQRSGSTQTDWPALHSPAPGHYYANEYMDSGFGSFESQYSESSHCLNNSHRLRSQQHSALPGNSCCSHAHSNVHHGSLDSHRQPGYPQVFAPGVPQQQSLPNPLPYNSSTPHNQQNYWPDPFQGFPQTKNSFSLPSIPSSQSHNSYGSYNSHDYPSWGHQQQHQQQQQQASTATFDPQRMELRKKLHAIFNPHQVDTVMEMFPHLTNAEKLAAEILNQKTQRGIF